MTAALFDLTPPELPAGTLRRSEWKVRPLGVEAATRLVVAHHYLHRPGPCSFAWSLTRANDATPLGVITYGTPSSAPLRRGIAGDEHANNVIELTRLWIDDAVPKNGESFLIGNTVRRVDKEIVVSFADASQGHLGYVYQSTNWLYTGLSAKRTDWTVEGIEKHGQTWADKYTADEMREQFGEAFTIEPRARKHRYVFLNCNRRRRHELLEALRYPVQPYPKAPAGGEVA